MIKSVVRQIRSCLILKLISWSLCSGNVSLASYSWEALLFAVLLDITLVISLRANISCNCKLHFQYSSVRTLLINGVNFSVRVWSYILNLLIRSLGIIRFCFYSQGRNNWKQKIKPLKSIFDWKSESAFMMLSPGIKGMLPKCWIVGILG